MAALRRGEPSMLPLHRRIGISSSSLLLCLPAISTSWPSVIESTQVSARWSSHLVSNSFIHSSTPNGLISAWSLQSLASVPVIISRAHREQEEQGGGRPVEPELAVPGVEVDRPEQSDDRAGSDRRHDQRMPPRFRRRFE